SPGTATAGADYEATNGTLTFAPFTTARTVLVRVLGDVENETDETFHLLLSAPTNAVLGSADGLGTIVDDDAVPALSIGDVRLPEGQSGTSDAVFTVALSAATTDTVTVSWSTANASARAGEDYQARAGQLSFAPGQPRPSLTVHVFGDQRRERNEPFLVNLANPSNARIARGQAQGTIDNDDGAADGCTPITAIPFTIDAPGRYCLTRNVALPLGSGAAILIEADDVQLDLQHHTLSETAGPSTQAYGVFA